MWVESGDKRVADRVANEEPLMYSVRDQLEGVILFCEYL